jgi:tetratricopeptide (TPR) repeat protein
VEASPAPSADKAAATPPAPPIAPSATPVEQVAAAPPADPAPPPTKPESPAARVDTMPSDATSPPAPKADARPVDALPVEVKRDSSGLRLIVPYRAPVPAALFARADALWFVVDSTTPLGFDAVRAQAAALVRDVTAYPLPSGAQAIRLRLERPQLASLAQADQGWVLSFADTAQAPSQQLAVLRNIADPARANVTIPFDQPSKQHRLTDPDSGDPLLVITALAPARGFIKKQDFVEFRLLQSVHGVVVEPNSDDVGVELAGDKILIGRPGGLTLSAAEMTPDRAPQAMRPMFDLDSWRDNVKAEFVPREQALLNAAAHAPDEKRLAARLDLARFYFAKGFYHEAKGVLDTVLADMRQGQEDATALVMRALARILINRPGEALKDLAHPVIGTNYDSQLWKAIALARQEKWAEAREKFKNVEFSVSALPVELQRIAVVDALRAMLAVRDYAGASAKVNELEIIGLGDEQRAEVAVLRGRLAEALGRDADASAEYREAIKSADRRAAAEATSHDLALRQRRGEIKPDELLEGLETLAVIWRGDAIEVNTLQQLAQFYAEQGRYRDALMAVRTATILLPNAEATRAMQSAASSWFGDVFLGSKGDDLPPIEALAMFYEFRELTPIGRRGDEMIRRLADRLAAIDLLDQASQLLQYQVDHRLEGAARAQVASRLATFYLMNRKPERAVAALRSSRIAELAGELRQQRLLLEARAQSDLGRHDLALDIISNLSGRETVRLRADIHWAARRWRDSAEQIEVLYGERWRDFQPLKSGEKADIMRAAIGYALAEDGLGIARLREKYGPLMADEADRKAFDIATRPVAATSSEFAEIARMAASVDTLEGFLREMKTRFPDVTAKAVAPAAPKADPVTTGSLPAIPGLKGVVKTR